MKTAFTSALSRFKSAPKPLRIFTYLLTAYATYALLLGVLVPAVIQSQAPEKLNELLGREVRLTEVKINPFILRVQLNGFAIAEQDATKDFVSFEQLELEVNFWQSLRNLTPTVDHIDLKQPLLNVARLSANSDNITFNFSDIPEHMANQQSEPTQPETEDEKPSGIPALLAHSISIQQGKLNFQDKPTGAKLNYQDLNFTLSQLDTQAFTFSMPADAITYRKTAELKPDTNFYHFAFTGADQSQLQLDGQFQLLPLEVKGDMSLSKLSLPPFWPFTENMIKAELTSGEINFASSYHLKQENEQFLVTTDKGLFSLTDLTFNDGEAPKVTLPKLELNGIEVSTRSQTVDLESITMAGLWVDASINDKGLDLQELFTPVAVKTAEAETPEVEEKTANKADEKGWLVRLNGFDMTDTDLNLKEKMVSEGVNWRIYPLGFSTGQIISDLSKPIDYQLNLGLSSDTQKQPTTQRGKFSSSGKLDAKALNVDGKLQLTALDLSQFQPYLEPHLNLELNKGAFSTNGEFSADNQGKATYQGTLALDSLLVKDGLKHEPLVKWKQMSMDSLTFDLADKSLNINKILLDSPYAKVLIAQDRRTNIGEIVVAKELPEESAAAAEGQEAVTENKEQAETESEQQTAAVQEEESGFAVDIGKIEIVNGSAYFADYSLTPNFASGIESLEGYIDHLSSTPGTKAKLDIKGKVDKYAPLALSGEVNPLIKPPYLDLDFSLDSAELTSVNPYSGTYVGYYIDKGQLSLDINYQLEDNKLNGTNHVVVDQLTLGKSSESELATSLPISLAIALLQDKDGVIDLGVDVSGDVDSPDFNIGSIILQALGNVITKAVTAPFSMLANLVGSDEELNIVEFRSGISALDSAGENRMNKLAKALSTRPKLKLSVEGAVNQQKDSHVLAEARLQQKLLTTSGLAELPSNLSASRIPESGPVASALENLFVQELKLDIIQERAKVEQKLKETEQVETVDPAKVTSVLHIGMYNQLIKAQEISNHDLGDLADARAKSIKAFLVNAEIEPARVFVLNSRAELKTEASQAILTLDAD